jgi:hypothetical protein
MAEPTLLDHTHSSLILVGGNGPAYSATKNHMAIEAGMGGWGGVVQHGRGQHDVEAAAAAKPRVSLQAFKNDKWMYEDPQVG